MLFISLFHIIIMGGVSNYKYLDAAVNPSLEVRLCKNTVLLNLANNHTTILRCFVTTTTT